jgi:hypothetical protein
MSAVTAGSASVTFVAPGSSVFISLVNDGTVSAVQFDNCSMPGGGAAPDPSIDVTSAVGTSVGNLNKADTTSLAIVGGSGAALFELYDAGTYWGVRTKAALSGSSHTIQVQDTTVGPAGSGEDRTDTLNIIVTGGVTQRPFGYGFIIG